MKPPADAVRDIVALITAHANGIDAGQVLDDMDHDELVYILGFLIAETVGSVFSRADELGIPRDEYLRSRLDVFIRKANYLERNHPL